MPQLTRWFIKSAMVYLALSLAMGFALAAQSMFRWPPQVAVLTPVYFHLFMVGWVTQLIFGVGHWMFPKYSAQQPRGSERLGVAVYILLNLGLALRAVGEPWLALGSPPAAGWLLAVSAVLQWLAGLGFVLNTWRRIKMK